MKKNKPSFWQNRFLICICMIFTGFFFAGTLNAQSLFLLSDTSRYIVLADSSSAALTKALHANPRGHFKTPIRIASQQEFDSLFDSATKQKLAPIDFQQYNLEFESHCPKCLALCSDEKNPCHRDRCNDKEFWLLRKKTATVSVAAIPFPGPNCIHAPGPQAIQSIITNDSAYQVALARCPGYEKPAAPDFSKYVLLVRWENHDCRAALFQETVEDPKSKIIHWRVSEQYGGCRGMSSTVLWELVPKKEGYSYSFE